MQRQVLIELIRKIQHCEGTEEEADNDIDLLCRSVADPQAANYIYYEELSTEEIADKIISYKPLQL
ncbi:hypothetical protein CIW64_14455 [Enterobacter cloacae]|uniref:hypothetical protein n=1 Tax=Enterobacter sichuanensis TaxID=2071710 RepID=UPI000BA8C793|nr:hypothetical protein [Enterobacter sichuanensis]PAN88671.1 hypothetical protein CIW64_14455 [Enterobacter cloacae]